MGNVTIIHPESGGVAEVPAESLPHHYRAGWRLLSEAEEQAAAEPEPEPKPMSRAQAAKAAKEAAAAADTGNEE